MDYTDEQLVKKYLKGDLQSFDVLTQRHLSALYNFVFKYMRSKSDSEDVTQASFLKAWQNLENFNPKFSFKTWLYTIAKRTALDALRKKHIVPVAAIEVNDSEHYILDNIVDKNPLLPETHMLMEDVQTLSWAIQQLPEHQQQVLSLYYLEGLNFREIGEKLKSSLNTIKTRHRRAILELKKIFVEK